MYEDLTYKIIGCAMKVHKVLGNGFQERIYHRCLCIEFERAKFSFGSEVEQTIYYEGIDVGTRRADFIIENKVILEIKAVIEMDNAHLAQIKNYLVAYDFDIGLLINFGSTSLQQHRIYHPRLKKGE